MSLLLTYLAYLTTLLLPVLIFIVLYIGTFDFSKSFNEIYITKKEFYLLLFGSILGMLGNIPLFMYGETFLGINIGGGVIPIVLALYFFKKKFSLTRNDLLTFCILLLAFSAVYTLILNSSLLTWLKPYSTYKTLLAILLLLAFSFTLVFLHQIFLKNFVKAVVFLATFAFLCVALTTYAITTYIPDLGIAAEFPQYLLPSVVAALLSLVFFRGRSEGLLFGYTTATLGTLVGADIYHLPEIYATTKVFAGAIGGAATMDMVFLAGLITFLMLLPFCGRNFWVYSPAFSRFNRIEFGVRVLLADAWTQYNLRRYREALAKAIEAIERFYGLVVKEKKSLEEFLAENGKHYALHDLLMLRAEYNNPYLNQYDAYRALVAVYYILGEIERCRMERYGGLMARSIAYLIDTGVVVVMLLPFVFLAGHFNPSSTEISETLLVSVFSLVGAVYFLYFTICEYLFGKTVGKKIMHLQVKEVYGNKPGIASIMMRNITRFIAVMLLSIGLTLIIIPTPYAIAECLVSFFLFLMVSAFSLIFILRSRHWQRLGDILAETVVVKG